MINFIICDDNLEMLQSVKNIINNVMMKNNYAYKIHPFTEYNQQFYQTMNSRISNKIYVLDIETKHSSGIDVARKIRIKDVNSVIIFLTSHDELGSVLLRDEIMFLTFINKLDNYKKRLQSAIRKSVQVIGKNKILRFEHHGAIFTIPEKDILYITRDAVERKIIIVTDTTEFKLSKTLSDMLSLLSNDFVQSHKSCIVNSRRINIVNKRTKKIIFDTGVEIEYLSNHYIKELLSCD